MNAPAVAIGDRSTGAEERVHDRAHCRETLQREFIKSRRYLLKFLHGAVSESPEHSDHRRCDVTSGTIMC